MSRWWWPAPMRPGADPAAAAAAAIPEAASPEPPPHPYYPPGVAVPGYAANAAPLAVLVAALAGMLACALLAAAVAARRLNPRLGPAGLAVVCWFVLNGCLHCVFEGYFVLNHAAVASSQNPLAQLWKEYALSDSRYLTSDPFMLSVESITAFVWGPLCLASAWAAAAAAAPGQGHNSSSSSGSAVRHPLRIVVCVAHLYGVALYYATALCELRLEGRSHSRPEARYFWLYYVGFNLPWVVVPAVLLLDSMRTVTRAMRALDRVDETLSGHLDRHGDAALARAAQPSEPKKTR
ncbi:Emopamil binding protein-domain-containing protein [Xylariaceae sp. FL0804]|nr:Emopamil binding protein-domain-containing protein [Xylariaceae sp. FL0804]